MHELNYSVKIVQLKRLAELLAHSVEQRQEQLLVLLSLLVSVQQVVQRLVEGVGTT